MKPLRICGLYQMSPKSAKLTFDRPVTNDEIMAILKAIRALVADAQKKHAKETKHANG